ncbi:hypothetical protein EV363DRAFT_1297812 [Boletus edulis]|nr:hypothetical protein EV363DRAFT_1297812 [Boletus edulis]
MSWIRSSQRFVRNVLRDYVRFLERIEDGEERQWIMMAVTNIGALLEYGRPGGVLRRAGDPEEKRIDVDDDAAKPESLKTQTSPVLSDPPLSIELSQAFKYAMQLSFSMLSLVLRNPTRKSSPFAESTLNPYLTVLLTILVTVSKHAEILAILERDFIFHGQRSSEFATIFQPRFKYAVGLRVRVVPTYHCDQHAFVVSDWLKVVRPATHVGKPHVTSTVHLRLDHSPRGDIGSSSDSRRAPDSRYCNGASSSHMSDFWTRPHVENSRAQRQISSRESTRAVGMRWVQENCKWEEWYKVSQRHVQHAHVIRQLIQYCRRALLHLDSDQTLRGDPPICCHIAKIRCQQQRTKRLSQSSNEAEGAGLFVRWR